jgi:hypothetical protein
MLHHWAKATKEGTDLPRRMRKMVLWDQAPQDLRIPPEIRVPLPNLEWFPWAQSRQEMRQRYEQYLGKVLKAYLDAGYTRPPERRQQAHSYWLAGYQVCGCSENRIAEAVPKDRAGVERAIKDLAKSIGLTPRPPRNNDRTQTVESIRAALARTVI